MFILVLCLSGLFTLIETIRVSRRTSWYLALIPLFLLFSMIGFNRYNRDYYAYENAFYDTTIRNGFEFGYQTLIDIVKFLGMDYRAIVFFVGALFLIVLLKFLKTNNHINLVVLFYSVYPLIFDINQTRNSLMYFLIILSLHYIIQRKPIKHFILLFLAFSMHVFTVMYLPFYYFCKKNRKQFIKLLVLLTLLFFATSPLIMKGVAWVFPEKMSIYLTRGIDFGVLIYWLYGAIDIFTVWWIDKRISKRVQEKDKRKLEVLYRFVWFPILTIPFMSYFTEIFRMQRNAILVKYIYCALAMQYMTIKEKIYTLLLLLISVMVYVVVIFYYGDRIELFDFLDENEIYYFLKKYVFY